MSRPTRINKSQLNSVYWPRWRAAEKVLMATGHSKTDAEEVRKEIHTEVTGSACSSKDLNNRTLDGCLAKFSAIATPRDGARQADLADGACKRVRFAIREIQERLKLPDAYIESISQRMNRRPLVQCDELQLLDILKALAIHENRHSNEPVEA